MASSDAWRGRVVSANARLVNALRIALSREFARTADEWARGVRTFDRHEARLRALIWAHSSAAATAFGIYGASMLAGAGEAKAEGDDPVRDVLRRIVALRVRPERVDAVVDDLMSKAGVVAAVAAAIAVTPLDLDAAAVRAAAAPVVSRAVRAAVARSVALDAVLRARPEPQEMPAGAPPSPPALPPAPPPGDAPPPGEGPRRPTFRERVAANLTEQARTRPRRLAENTREKVNEALRQGALAGEGPEKVAARVRDAIAGDVGMARARVIARTEIGAAQNAALIAIAEEGGAPFEMEWVAVEDGRTRPTHAAADGQVRRPGERFQVGEASLRWPCDPEGPPGEIINCRCTILLRRLSAPAIAGPTMQP